MTEIERILTNVITIMEQELRQAQENQAKTLSGQEKIRSSHTQALHQIQQHVSSLRAQQRESRQQLQRLSKLSMRFEPLLTRLNVILSEK